MSIEEVIEELRRLNEPVPKSGRLPTEDEVCAAEKALGLTFSADYRRYLLEASNTVYGTLEPALVIPDAGYLDLVEIAKFAWEGMCLPRNLLPICDDNADYYCLNEKGEVLFWPHDGTSEEKWPDLATWIKEVWIEGN